jgi:hypothetical protein
MPCPQVIVLDIAFIQEFFYGRIQQITTLMFLNSEVSDFCFVLLQLAHFLQSVAKIIGNNF